MTLRGLRRLTAVLLPLAAVLFTVGTQIERAGHTDTAAEHTAENAPSLSPSPIGPGPSASTARATPAAPRAASSAKDPGLSAPEGGQEREAAERRKRAAAAT